MQEQSYTITINTENKPEVLYRVTDMFMRRKLPMEHVSMEATEKGNAIITIETTAADDVIAKLKKQIERIIEVIKVSYM